MDSLPEVPSKGFGSSLLSRHASTPNTLGGRSAESRGRKAALSTSRLPRISSRFFPSRKSVGAAGRRKPSPPPTGSGSRLRSPKGKRLDSKIKSMPQIVTRTDEFTGSA